MFRNLKAEMARKGLIAKELAEKIHISKESMTNKMCGKTEFTRKEMIDIKNTEFPSCTLDYLFGDGPDEPKAG
ncbi:MAG: hypothetical protein AAGU75_08260 [Bacillota bacterium]